MSKYLLLFILVFADPIFAQTMRLVPSQYSTIQAAINAAQNGDTVLVQPGIYYEQINISNKIIYISSKLLTTNDTSYISNTIIDGNILGSVVTFTENANTTLNGFTIRNGSANVGGGINVYRSSPTLKNLLIVNNKSIGDGGGIYASNENGYGKINIVDTYILNNKTVNGDGGGATFFQCIFQLNNVKFIQDTSGNRAGGLHISSCYSADPQLVSRIDSCRFTENYSGGSGGGIFIFRSNPIISNTTIDRNITPNAGGGLCATNEGGYGTIVICRSIIDSNRNGSTNMGGGLAFYGANVLLTNSVISRNSADNNGGGLLLIDAYSADPQLVSRIDSCRFTENHSVGSGAGIFIFRSNPKITNTTIDRNITLSAGGGLSASNEGGYGTIVISRSIIDSNSNGTSTNMGGGLAFYGANVLLTNSVIL